MLEGTSLDLYQSILHQFPAIKLIASGGVTRVDEISQLETMGVTSVIIGKAIYEGVIKLEDLKKFI
jgi:phosphoribosylformimino-5-aminoimidazole carboxamide ribotide isomerase